MTPAKLLTVAIADPSNTSKSTLANDLARHIGLSNYLVPMDGFHLNNVTPSACGLLFIKAAPKNFDLAGF